MISLACIFGSTSPSFGLVKELSTKSTSKSVSVSSSGATDLNELHKICPILGNNFEQYPYLTYFRSGMAEKSCVAIMNPSDVELYNIS